MTEQEFEAVWIEVCSELRMSMDGVYFEAAVMLAKKAIAVEREACAKVCDGLANNPVWLDRFRDGAAEAASLIRARFNARVERTCAASGARSARTTGCAAGGED